MAGLAPYRIEIKAQAAQEIRALPTKRDRSLVMQRIQSLAQDPRPPGCKKLVGHDAWRTRQGRYRILYTVDDDVISVVIIRVGSRKSVYRR
ncbi:MAG: mRNA interferase RelE/StbE [Rhodothermales bacterium]